MEFNGDKFKSEEFGVLWSPDLTTMFPEFADVRLPSMKPEDDFVEFVTNCKETLEGHLHNANSAWEERSKVMLKIVDLFADLDGVAVNLDSDTMAGLDIVFRTPTMSHLYTVTLHAGAERGDGRVEYFTQKEGEKPEKVQTWEATAKKLEDMGEMLLDFIQEDIARDSG